MAFSAPSDAAERVILAAERAGEQAGDDGALRAAMRDAVVAATRVMPDEIVLLPRNTLPLTSSGKVTSSSMGRKRTGKWRVDKDQLCVEFEKETPNCYEVLVSGKKVKMQREGILPLEGVVEPPSGRI